MPGVCHRCKRNVYVADEKIALGKVWHNFCVSCRKCRKLLDECSAKLYQDEIYCQKCFRVLSGHVDDDDEERLCEGRRGGCCRRCPTTARAPARAKPSPTAVTTWYNRGHISQLCKDCPRCAADEPWWVCEGCKEVCPDEIGCSEKTRARSRTPSGDESGPARDSLESVASEDEVKESPARKVKKKPSTLSCAGCKCCLPERHRRKSCCRRCLPPDNPADERAGSTRERRSCDRSTCSSLRARRRTASPSSTLEPHSPPARRKSLDPPCKPCPALRPRAPDPVSPPKTPNTIYYSGPASKPKTSEPTCAPCPASRPKTSEPTSAPFPASRPNTSEPTGIPYPTSRPKTSQPTDIPYPTSRPKTSEPTSFPSPASRPKTSEPTCCPCPASRPKTSEPTSFRSPTSRPKTSEPTSCPCHVSRPKTSEPTSFRRPASRPKTSEPTSCPCHVSRPKTSEPTSFRSPASRPKSDGVEVLCPPAGGRGGCSCCCSRRRERSTSSSDRESKASSDLPSPAVKPRNHHNGLSIGRPCRRCGRQVYHAELVLAAGTVFHTSCFSCRQCRKPLESTTVYDAQNEIFCKQCYQKRFGPSGYGYGLGAGALQTP